jgi:hypothetical protein
MKTCNNCYWGWRLNVSKWGARPCRNCNKDTIDKYWRKDK